MCDIAYVLLGIIAILFCVEWILIGQLIKAKDDTIKRISTEKQMFRDDLNAHLKMNHT